MPNERELKVLKDRNLTEKDILYLKIGLKHTLEALEEYGVSILPHLTDTKEKQ